MSEKPTMETVECWKRVHSRYNDPRTPHFPVETYCVDYERAIRLERERDALREAFKAACAFIDSHVADPDITDEMVCTYAEFQRHRALLGKGTG